MLDREWLNSLTHWDGSKSTLSPLDEPRRLLSILGNPQDSYPTIHIAGTNGKGSTAFFLSELSRRGEFSQSNRLFEKVGLLTSPHLTSVEERCLINGIPISGDLFESAIRSVRLASQKLSIKPTYFTAVVCASFYALRESKVNLAVVEVGLGGKLDVTNLISKPILSIITTVGLDHVEVLGHSLEEIASSKAGIIKHKVPVLIGKLPVEARNVVIEIAKNLFSQLIEVRHSVLDFVFSSGSNRPEFLRYNLSLAIEAVLFLGFYESLDEIGDLKRLPNLAARFEVFVGPKGGVAVVDGAHNPQGVSALLSSFNLFLNSEETSLSGLTIVLCFLERKSWREMVGVLVQYLNSLSVSVSVYVLSPGTSLYVTALEVEKKLGRPVKFSQSAGSILDLINLDETPVLDNRLLFFGSLSLAGTIRAELLAAGWRLNPLKTQ